MKRSVGLLLFCLSLPASSLAAAEQIPFIDTHAHLENPLPRDTSAAMEDAIKMMDRFHIRTTLLMPVPHVGQAATRNLDDVETLAGLTAQHPGRFFVVGGAAALAPMLHGGAAGEITDADRAQFAEAAQRVVDAGVVGFGEIGITHFALPAMGARHQYGQIAADHPYLLVLADIAARNDIPIDVHFDVVAQTMDLPPPLKSPPNPARLDSNLPAFERFLSHNGKARIIWAHAGGEPMRQRTVELCRALFERHPNLYMSLRVQLTGPHPAFALNSNGSLKPIWKKLLTDYSERFVLGSDAFYTDRPPDRRGGKEEGMERFQMLLAQLPPEVAAKIARDNARRIYRLPG